MMKEEAIGTEREREREKKKEKKCVFEFLFAIYRHPMTNHINRYIFSLFSLMYKSNF